MQNNRYLYWITFVAINGGLLFGLNMAGISGAVDMIKGEFSLSDSGLGTVAALLTVGCLVGALFTGSFTEKYGRKNVMIFTSKPCKESLLSQFANMEATFPADFLHAYSSDFEYFLKPNELIKRNSCFTSPLV